MKSYFAILNDKDQIWSLWIGALSSGYDRTLYADEVFISGMPRQVGLNLKIGNNGGVNRICNDDGSRKAYDHAMRYIQDTNFIQLTSRIPKNIEATMIKKSVWWNTPP